MTLPLVARTVPDPADPLGFFLSVGDRLLHSTFPFGISNIPVQTNGVFCYSPSVHRLLQVTANVRDAANTNFYPTVYRPQFLNDGQGNVSICGWSVVDTVSGYNDPILIQSLDISALPIGVSSNNVYGVPWILGVKKNLPVFNAFYAFNTLQVQRRLLFNRPTPTTIWSGTGKSLYTTNQMLLVSLTNHIGFSFWNPYSSNYNNPFNLPNLFVAANLYVRNHLRYGAYNYSLATNYSFLFYTNQWPGAAWSTAAMPRAFGSPNSILSFYQDIPYVGGYALDLDNNGNVNGSGFTMPNLIRPLLPSCRFPISNRTQRIGCRRISWITSRMVLKWWTMCNLPVPIAPVIWAVISRILII
ncbi:MAG TPA: hypothetical protein VF607_05885 [Verrucomicrobiae bacterium]